MRCEELSAGKLLEKVSLLLRMTREEKKEKSLKEKQIQRRALRLNIFSGHANWI